jgi:hypothetical protein
MRSMGEEAFMMQQQQQLADRSTRHCGKLILAKLCVRFASSSICNVIKEI